MNLNIYTLYHQYTYIIYVRRRTSSGMQGWDNNDDETYNSSLSRVHNHKLEGREIPYTEVPHAY